MTRSLIWILASLVAAPLCRADDEPLRFFENQIRPLLVAHCLRCHGDEEQSGGLRVDSRGALVGGGDRGAALVPGDAQASLIVQAVGRTGDLKMPPDEPLADADARRLVEWIEMGAPWPDGLAPLAAPDTIAATAARHWAFQPVREPDVPPVAHFQWPLTPIDAFVLARLEAVGLEPSARASRRTLARRVSYTLTGLPPSPASVEEFLHDPRPDAYAAFVDRLLESPEYGEQWARHWLDVARYSDTKGYVYAREERFWVHAWSYRDWVVGALNRDLPYDRFLLLQLAADQVDDAAESDMAAMGFLTLGRRFLGVKHNIIDDRIDVVCRGTMALTVGCARCHDHKYDPIPTADYYSLYGVFDSSAERTLPLSLSTGHDEAFERELAERRKKLNDRLTASRAESADRVRERIGQYLHAQTELEKYPADGFDQVFQKSDLLPAFVRQWERYLHTADRETHPVFVHWHAYARIVPERFSEQSPQVTAQLAGRTGEVNRLVAERFRSPPDSFAAVAERYGELFLEIDHRWKAALQQAAEDQSDPPMRLADDDSEALRCVLYGPAAPCEVPDESIVHTETFFDSGTCTELWKLEGEVDRWINRAPIPVPYAKVLVDRTIPTEPRVFERGNSLKLGDQVPRQFLSALAGEERRPFAQGSGRRELADAIIDPANPLTARVIVNRVWAQHFGAGLVRTPSDFGLRAEDPSHPALLDWLAARFSAEGWSLKKLHRWILLSETFRQSSTGPQDPEAAARAIRLDPSNRLLWRANVRRLAFEELRDSMLAASGQLDRQRGGRPADLFAAPYPHRRTLYGLVDRQFLPGTLRVFDFANPDLHIAKRPETTVPQQALFFLNHPLVLEQVSALAAASIADEPRDTVRAIFHRVFQRPPTRLELNDSLEFVSGVDQAPGQIVRPTAADWHYGYGTYDESAERVTNYTALPHFTGQAWQGGPQWPDAKLGWVQLTADGGHPGNDRQHAAVRRWVAPRAMTIDLHSKLVHEAEPGDGIRAMIISSRAGSLGSATIHQKTVDLNIAGLEVEPGESIDFLVDIRDVLNSDQYLWSAVIQSAALDGDCNHEVWDSKLDFSQPVVRRLTAWEQLAHVLICTNEFLFVD